MKKFKRIILIEPNLISYGHVVELPLNLQRYLNKKHLDNVIVGNKVVVSHVSKLFPDLVKKITNSCFRNLEDKGNQFYKDLLELDRLTKFDKNDLILILTSYTNEIYGIKRFVKEREIDSPIFCLWCHQLFPPEKNFLSTLKSEYREVVRKRMKKAYDLQGLNNKIFLFTTPSSKLKKTYQDWTEEKFGTLPIPYIFTKNPSLPSQKKKLEPTLGFMGDGRYEKGLLLALETILNRNDDNKYIIQILNPRGFPKKDLDRLNKLLGQLRMRRNIKLYDGPLLPGEFSNLINKIDIVLLPYHPGSYDARISAILVESIIKGKIVVTTADTWLGEQVDSMKTGELFEYTANQGVNIANFNSAIDKVLSNGQYNVKTASLEYWRYHNPDNFFKMLFKQIR